MLATAEQEVAALQRRYSPAVQACLRERVAEDSDLFRLLRYHLGWEDADGRPSDDGAGKGLRPVLCLMACELAGGDWQRALPASAALELIHNFSLIHDDIQDEDATRRGRPTLWNIHGKPVAVAAGNAMCVLADRLLAGLADRGVPAETVIQASVHLTRRYLEMIEGQVMDMSFEDAERVTVSEYMDMISRKTGALIDGAMYLGALVATEDARTAEAFGAFGRRLGLAFQVRDDYLGVWGDPAATGKAVGADIRRKKKSLPIVYLFEQAPASRRDWLRETYAAEEVNEAGVQGVLELLDELDAQSYVNEIARNEAHECMRAVEALGLREEAHRKLEAMAAYFVSREK